MTIIAKDFNPNGIEWTCNFCNRDRTFKAGKPPVFGADPCPVCGELRKPYVYPTREEMEAAGCLPAPARVLRTLPPTNAGYYPDGSLTGEVGRALDDVIRLACDPQRTVDWDE